jgi:hypothetical protein
MLCFLCKYFKKLKSVNLSKENVVVREVSVNLKI